MKSAGVWVYLVGILMFIWGFCQLGYALMGFYLPISIPFTEWGSIFGEDELFNDVQLGLAFGAMLSGFGMLIFKAWSRVLAVWLVWAFAGFFFYISLLIGPVEFEDFFIRQSGLFFAIAFVFLWFFNQRGTRETLNSDPDKKSWQLIPVCTLILLGSGYYVFINLPNQLPLIFTEARFPEIQTVEYTPKGKQYYARRYERTELPLPFTLAVPKGSTLVSLNQASGFNGNGHCDVQLDTPGHSMSLFLTRQTSVQEEWASPRTQEFLDRIHPLPPYQYARKIFSDRKSISYWQLRNEIGAWGGDEIHAVNMRGLKGFVVKAKNPGDALGKSIRWYFDFNLYDQDAAAGGGRLFVFKGGEATARNILASLQPRLEQTKTASDFYQEGLKQSKKKKYEKAKMAFASALCLEGDNPDFHYSMGEAFYKTRNYEQADRHLTQAVNVTEEFKSDWESFEAVLKLFEKTRKKLGKPTTLEPDEKT